MRALWFLPFLVGCASPPPWEPPTRENPWVLRPFDWLITQQNDDGSWGEGMAPTVEGFDIGRVGITGLALMAAHAAHHTQYSKEQVHGRSIGVAVRSALVWLISQQDPLGRFRDARSESLDHAMGTCALLDNYGWTVDTTVKSAALSSLAALMRLKKSNGTWGSTSHTWWAWAALDGARLAEAPHDERALAKASRILDEEFDRKPGFETAVAPVVRHFKGSREKERRSLDWVAARPPDSREPAFPAWYFGSTVIYNLTLNPDPAWLRWTEALMGALEATASRTGHWPGSDRDASIVRTSLVALICRNYESNRHAEYRNVFGGKK